MGCDIHVHIEVKMEDKWRHYSAPLVNRNYRLFAKMAGVRNYDNVKIISKPKGIPNDITYITKIDYEHWKVDAHDASYLNIEEIIELEKYIRYNKEKFKTNTNPMPWLETIFSTYLFNNGLTGWYKYSNDNDMDIEDLRIVFWFDS